VRATRDTFLKFLADNLSETIHPVRRDPDKPDSDLLQMGAVNVQFLNPDYSVHVSDQIVSIDVVHENELSALDMATNVWKLLSTRFYTPKYDYTVPSSPVALGDVIFWSEPIRFRPVHSPKYFHLHCRLALKHHIH
jgi:hypothetical protein